MAYGVFYGISRFALLLYVLLLMSARKGCHCHMPLDLVFAFDSSKSMSQDYWFRQVDLVEKLLHQIKISHKETHVGIIDFSDHVHDRVKLVDGYQGDVIFQRLEKLRLEYEGGSHTYTDQALLDAANLFKHSPLSRNALSVLVMLTDGKMTLSDHFIGESKVRERVSELKALGVKIFCITFGDTLYIEGLHAIVGAHNTEFIYQSESFNVSHFIQRLQLVLPKQEYEPGKSKLNISLGLIICIVIVGVFFLAFIIFSSFRKFLRKQAVQIAAILHAYFVQ